MGPAGAHGHSLDEVLSEVELFEIASGATRHVVAADAGFRYRGSALPGDGAYPSAVVGSMTAFTSATLSAGKPPWRACSRTMASLGAM